MEISTQRTEASPPLQRRPSRPRAREYSGPLGILAAGALGLSLLCSVSAMAMGDLNRYIPVTLVPLNIFDLAVSNLETAAALTEQVVTVFVPTATLTAVPTETERPSLTPEPSDTPRRFVTITPTIPRRTREPATPTRVPTSTPRPTNTPAPTSTNTLRPTNTPTAVPPTNTLIPTDTRTPIPDTNTPIPDTNTPVPDTDTPQPPPDTDTPEPPPTQIAFPASNPTDTPGP